MNDVLGMRRVQRVGNLGADREQGLQLQRPPADAVLQGIAIQKLHDDEPLPLMAGNLMDGADVGMVQGRSGPGFAAKALQRLGIVGHFVGQKLQSHEAAKHEVFGLVHHAHAPAAQLFQDAIVRDGLTDHRRDHAVDAMVGAAGKQVNPAEDG